MSTSSKAAVCAAPLPIDPRARPPVASKPPIGGPVLHPAVLITDSTGDIVFWNTEARQALARLGDAGCLDDLFDREVLDRLFVLRDWIAVTPRGAADPWRVRARRMLDSGQALVFFFADAAQ